jgi:iron(III) transport system substrate-binding protein
MAWVSAAAAIAGLAACQPAAPGQGTAPDVVRRAFHEGEVVVYGNSDMAGPVVAGFERRFPRVKVRYRELTATAIRDAIIAEAPPGRPAADLAWSSSMDIQVKLVNDGYAQPYRSAGAARLPRWAVWRDMGFGVTAEPIGFAYNRRLLAPADVPKSHGELLRAIRENPARWRGKIAMYDPAASGVGFMYLSADTQVYPEAWTLMAEIGRTRPGLYVPGGAIISRLSSGEHLLAYNMNSSYADAWANRDPAIGYVTPTDYHFMISRIVFIPRSAPHPHAARLFLDYLLSEEGQQKLREGRLTPILASPPAVPLPAGGRPIRVGPALLANLDQARRARLLAQWRGGLWDHQDDAGDARSPSR